MTSAFSSRPLTAALLRSGIAAAALSATSPALAGQAEPVLSAEDDDAIVVTARRREESAQDVPIALTVVSADTLDRTGSFNLLQIQQLVPSLQLSALNQRSTSINIRGLGANSAVAIDGLEYGVGFYVDGVYYARPGQSQFDLIDLDRVEVLRGPQGTLFGKNTTAGAINVTTRLPSFTPEATVEGQVGNRGFHQLRASVSVPLVADRVAVRLSLADTHRDSLITNVHDGRPGQDYDNFTVRGQLLVKPSETLSLRLIGDYSRQKQHAIGSADGYFGTYANGQAIPNNIFDRAARYTYTLLPGNAFLRLADLDGVYGHEMKSYGVSGELNWDVGPATLTAITAYRWWDWYPDNDIDGTSIPVFDKGQAISFQRQFTQELRLASNGINRIDYQAGLYYFWQVVNSHGTIGYGPEFAGWNGLPAIAGLALNTLKVGTFSNPSTRSYAGFGQADWHITDALTLTGGLRFTHERKAGSFRQFWVPGTGVDLATLSPIEAATVRAIRNTGNGNREFSFAARERDNAVSGLATLSYRLSSDALVYATYAHGSKSGGLNLSNAGLANPVVDPEKVDSFEIGLKSQWLDRRVTLNLNAFQTNVRDYQANRLDEVLNANGQPTGQFGDMYIANIPKVRSRGAEGDLTVAPSRWVRFTASAAYTDARFIRYANAQQAPERTNEGPVQDLSGVRMPGVPKFAYNLALDLAQPLGGGGIELYGRADYLHRSSYNATANNSRYGIIPAYGLVHARIGVRKADGTIDLSIWARNLTNEDYYLTRTVAGTGVVSAQVGEPRLFGGTLRVKW